MGMNSFATGLSGLNTNGQGLEVVGNNLANLNTLGFKSSNISFSEVLGRLGSQVAGVHSVFSQGGVQTSANPLDVAIQGNGFFVVGDSTGTHYTRAGNLQKDLNGFLVAENGMKLQGYSRNPTTGVVDDSLGVGDIQLTPGLLPPVPTSEFSFGMNLDSSKPTGTNTTVTFPIYDSQGTAHKATLSLAKDISSDTPPITRWRFDLTIPAKDVAGQDPLSTEQYSLMTGAVASATVNAGALQFDDHGVLISAYAGPDQATPPALADIDVPPTGIAIPVLANGAAMSAIKWHPADSAGKPTITNLGSPTAQQGLTQDGTPPGTMGSVSVSPDGTLVAAFSNGRKMDVGKLVLAQFANPDGLRSEGGGIFEATAASGISRVGTPGEAGLGRLMGNAIEQSNVDLASELTKVITYQRGYQASAKIITTSDQILQETLNLMR